MPRYILHHQGVFFEWSTIVDAPVSAAMTCDEFKDYYRERHGSESMKDLPARLARAKTQGCSSLHAMSAEDCIAGNRAGAGEKELSFDAVIEMVKREM